MCKLLFHSCVLPYRNYFEESTIAAPIQLARFRGSNQQIRPNAQHNNEHFPPNYSIHKCSLPIYYEYANKEK